VFEEQPKALIVMDGKMLEVNLPPQKAEMVRAGTMMKLAIKTMQPIDIVNDPDPLGSVVSVRRVIDSKYSEVEGDKGQTLVYNGELRPNVGDRVILDHSGHVVVKNLGKEDDRFTFSEETGVSFDDIGGLTEAKDALRDSVELPYLHPEIYKRYGKKLPKGILLYGPPGCGKTMLGKGTATAIANIHGKKTSTAFNYVKGPEILSKWVGEAESTIRKIFEKCRDHKKEHGYPAVLFIDEAESILGKRGSGISSDIEKTIVPQFLSEMDGMEDSAAFIILATNRPDMLDSAVIREGRIDRKIRVSRPDKDMAKDIFAIHFGKKPMAESLTVDEMAAFAAESIFSPDRALAIIERKSGDPVPFTLGHVASGAMIAGIVEDTVSVALKRDLKSGECNGVRKEDLEKSIVRIHGEYKLMSHKDEIDTFTSEWKADVKSVKRVS
jgi:proteasome-associated ATPase